MRKAKGLYRWEGGRMEINHIGRKEERINKKHLRKYKPFYDTTSIIFKAVFDNYSVTKI